MGNNEKNLFDETEIRNSSIESINQDELMELKEINDRIWRIREETIKITHITSDRMFNEVYFS